MLTRKTLTLSATLLATQFFPTEAKAQFGNPALDVVMQAALDDTPKEELEANLKTIARLLNGIHDTYQTYSQSDSPQKGAFGADVFQKTLQAYGEEANLLRQQLTFIVNQDSVDASEELKTKLTAWKSDLEMLVGFSDQYDKYLTLIEQGKLEHPNRADEFEQALSHLEQARAAYENCNAGEVRRELSLVKDSLWDWTPALALLACTGACAGGGLASWRILQEYRDGHWD